MQRSKSYQHAFFVVGALIAFFVGDRAYQLYAAAVQSGITNPVIAFTEVLNGLPNAIASNPFFFDKSIDALKWGGIAMLAVLMGWGYWWSVSSVKRRSGEEQGSSRWGTMGEAKQLKGKGNQNVIFSQNVQLHTENFGGAKRKFNRNLNVCVIGGSGSGKTAFIVKPNAHQMNGSYILTDPKGTLLPEIGQDFVDNNYKVTVFNTKDFSQSMHYNPFEYIRTDKDIVNIVGVLMKNTNGEGSKSGEDFWVKAEELWLISHIAYLWYVCPAECTFKSLVVLLGESKVSEEDESARNPVDELFDDLEKKDPLNFAVLMYKQYKNAAGKTAKSILISVSARLRLFNLPVLQEITSYDELALTTVGERKTAMFLIMDDTNKDYAFLHAMVVYQLINGLCHNADTEHNGALPVPVQFILDEFANLMGKIPDFEQSISVIRSRRISAMIILQSLSQLTNLYDKAADIIVDCCDTVVFLGGKSVDTTEKLSKMMGNESIMARNNSTSKGQQGSFSLSDNVMGRALLDPAEIGRLPMDECLVLISGMFPFKDKKYPTFDQKWFKEMKRLDVDKWFSSKGHMVSGERVVNIPVTFTDEDVSALNELDLSDAFGDLSDLIPEPVGVVADEPSTTVVQGQPKPHHVPHHKEAS